MKPLIALPGGAAEAQELLASALKKNWDTALMRWYGLLPTNDATRQLAMAEGWVKRYPQQAMLYLTLGRLAMRCQLWGKARGYFEQALKWEPTPEAYAEYGKLQEKLGEVSAALQSYRQGLAGLMAE